MSNRDECGACEGGLTQLDKVPRLLRSVSDDAPALSRAQLISERAVAVGFEWDTLEDVWDQLRSEEFEVRQAYAALQDVCAQKAAVSLESLEVQGNSEQQLKHELELEVGDLLFSVVNLARWMGVDAEDALNKSSDKFTERWEHMENAAYLEQRALSQMSTQELEQLWQQAKRAHSGVE